MRRKRLKHYTDIFCEMFVGWRLSTEDINNLAEVGKGTLVLDFIENKIYDAPDGFNLFVFNEIQAWFEQNLVMDRIDKSNIIKARLLLNLEVMEENRLHSRTFKVITVMLDMEAEIQTDEKSYKNSKKETLTYNFIKGKQV